MISTNGYALLCLLSIEPMNGYLMKQWVDKLLSHYWKTSYGQIYPTMKAFIRDQLVTVEDMQNENGQRSKYYHITDKGLDALKAWLSEDASDFNQRDESLLKYKFSFLLPIDEVISKAERSLQQLEQVHERYCNDATRMQQRTNPNRDQLMTYLATKKGVYLHEARIQWTKECIETLKNFDEGSK